MVEMMYRMKKMKQESDDPFLSKLFSLSAKSQLSHPALGQQLPHRDSYLYSNHPNYNRWWKSKPKYTSVATTDVDELPS